MSYSHISLTKDELRQYKQKFIETYIRTFDIHLRQLVDMRNKIFNHVRQMDELINNTTSNIVRFDLYSDFHSVFANEPVPDKWVDIFNEITTKINQNIVEFNNLDVVYLGDLGSLDLDQRIISSIKNS